MKKLAPLIHDTENGLDYILVGEIYLPLIAVPEETRDIGILWKSPQKLSERLQEWTVFLLVTQWKTLDASCRCK